MYLGAAASVVVAFNVLFVLWLERAARVRGD
jgi:hypothetical protein